MTYHFVLSQSSRVSERFRLPNFTYKTFFYGMILKNFAIVQHAGIISSADVMKNHPLRKLAIVRFDLQSPGRDANFLDTRLPPLFLQLIFSHLLFIYLLFHMDKIPSALHDFTLTRRLRHFFFFLTNIYPLSGLFKNVYIAYLQINGTSHI